MSTHDYTAYPIPFITPSTALPMCGCAEPEWSAPNAGYGCIECGCDAHEGVIAALISRRCTPHASEWFSSFETAHAQLDVEISSAWQAIHACENKLSKAQGQHYRRVTRAIAKKQEQCTLQANKLLDVKHAVQDAAEQALERAEQRHEHAVQGRLSLRAECFVCCQRYDLLTSRR